MSSQDHFVSFCLLVGFVDIEKRISIPMSWWLFIESSANHITSFYINVIKVDVLRPLKHACWGSTWTQCVGDDITALKLVTDRKLILFIGIFCSSDAVTGRLTTWEQEVSHFLILCLSYLCLDTDIVQSSYSFYYVSTAFRIKKYDSLSLTRWVRVQAGLLWTEVI